MALSPDRLDRFARHLVLPEIGGPGQVALTKAHVVLVGLGGIGSPVLQYLAGAGIGHFTLIDSGKVEASNLQRQTIYSPAELDLEKTQAAANWLAHFDREIAVEIRNVAVNSESAAKLVAGADLVIDGTDNFATRLAVSDACVSAGVPLLSAAVGRFQGQVGAFAGHIPGQPCYRCFVGDAFDTDDCDSCAEDGILGAMAGWVGSFAAMQAVRILLADVSSFGETQFGRLHLLDGLKPGMRTMTIAKDPACRACSGS